MANKHSDGPRCPFCPKKRFKDSLALKQHQRARGHFPAANSDEPDDERRARVALQKYHQDKIARAG